ncbi:cytochrome P450 2H2-like [Paramacrobiotus metropolitanus]|uniref:cytochrome P450 2H2-like n=1 Tax=Paramacrobiotus metropolitanus TaxID=2943436 RepID=UPI00244642CD|nr:cytochrome P450 2H2-like [Paramacrobiotus metropolitanus]
MIEFVIGAVVLLLAIAYFRSSRHKNLPPGPPGLPFAGHILEFTKDPPFKKFMEWSKKYGDTIMVHMGNQYPMVVMHGYDTMKKAFNEEVNAARDQRFLFNDFFQGHGLIISQRGLWKERRRFAISTLRDFGMGKTWLEDNIIAEVEDMCAVLRKQNKQPFDPKTLLSHSVSNVICALVFGKRFAHTDAKFTKLASLFPENVRITGPTTQNKFSSEEVDDYIDAFIKEGKKQQEKGAVNSTFTDKQLVTSVLNLFAAGTETTSTTTLWSLVFLIENPDVMCKMQKEIDDNIPRDRPVRMDGKGLLPYTEAAILEVQRCASLVPICVLHQTLADTVIDGYTVPKGTLLAPNLYSIHHDPRYWKNPDKFDPTRFQDASGKVTHPTGFAPFQVGKRSCLGEALAKMELYLFISNIVKNFNLENAPGNKVSHEDYVASIVLAPAPYKIVFVPR